MNDEEREAPRDVSERFGKLLRGELTDDREEVRQLLRKIKEARPALEKLLERCCACQDEVVYRFYHQSWKVYGYQAMALEIVDALKGLVPPTPRRRFEHYGKPAGGEGGGSPPILNPWFMEIVLRGTGKEFEAAHNADWAAVTRPIVEAFFHAKFFLEAAVAAGREIDLDRIPALLPTGWAALLYLYDLR